MNRKNFAATGSFLAEDRPRVLDYIGVDSQLMFNTFHNSRLYEWEHPDASGRLDLDLAYGAARAHNRGMTEFCSVDDRLLPDVLRPARRLRPCRSDGDRGDRDGRCRAARRVRLSGRALAVAPLARPGLAAGGGGRHPGRVPRRWHRRADRPGLLRQRAADPARLPRRRGELPLGRLHGDPVPADADARDDDLRRRARAAPAAARRRDRAGLHLAPELAQADGVGDGRVRPPRGASARPCR